MRRLSASPAWLGLAGALLANGVAHAQGAPKGFWPVAGGAAVHNRWQKAETDITPDTVAKNFKFLWKLKLGSGSGKSLSYSETLLTPGLITGKGFKDLAFVADAHTLYAVDSELGALVWKRDIPAQAAVRPACAGANMQVATEAPQVIHFGAHKPATAHPATPPPPPSDAPVPATERRIGASAGGGYFGLKGVYVLTNDGYLHEQIMATGLDYAPPVKFLPAGSGTLSGLNMSDKVVYAAAGQGCRNAADAVWAIDLNDQAYATTSYQAHKVSLAGSTAPALGSDGTAYAVTGSGQADAAAGVYPDSVIALSQEGLKVKDWYTATAPGKVRTTGPLVFSYKGKDWIAAPGSDGSLLLLDSASLGGPDHHTPIARTAPLLSATKQSAWKGLAAWQDKTGTAWVLAAFSGPASKDAGFAAGNTPALHGGVAAFKVEDNGGHITLTPVWLSPDLSDPPAPVVANGVVFALDAGKPSSHATLHALDAGTGKELFSSGDLIQSWAHSAGMSVGDGHVFFTTHDNTLYSFGIPLEH